MTARYFFFEQAAEFHLQCIGVGWQTEVQIKEAVVHRFQGQRKTKLTFGFCVSHLTLHLGEPSHRADGHVGYCLSGASLSFGCSMSTNCKSYNRRYVPIFFINSSCAPIS